MGDKGKTFLVTIDILDGLREDNRESLEDTARRLMMYENALGRKVEGSSNWVKAKLKLDQLSGKLENQKLDMMHKLALDIVRKNDIIGIENSVDDVSNIGVGKNKKYTLDSMTRLSWGTFKKIIKSKASRFGKTVITLGRTFTCKDE